VKVLGGDDVVRVGDIVCIGSKVDDWHSWTKISNGSPYMGYSVKKIREMFPFVGYTSFGRKVE